MSKIGSFKTDIPNCILKASIIDTDKKELNCCLDWCERENGVKPEPTWIHSNEIKLKAPIILCDFLMKHIKFPSSCNSVKSASTNYVSAPNQETQNLNYNSQNSLNLKEVS